MNADALKKEWKHQQRLLDAEEKIEAHEAGNTDDKELKKMEGILKVYKSN